MGSLGGIVRALAFPKNKVYTIADNIITSLGFTTEENFAALKQGKSGIAQTSDPKITQVPMYTSIINSDKLISEFSKIGNADQYTRLEKMMILSSFRIT